MGEFADAVLSFPVVLFSFMLVVVVGYWVVALLGGLGVDELDADTDPEVDGDGFSGALAAVGLGGVPVTVVLSLLIAVGWFGSLVGGVLLDAADVAGVVRFGLGLVVLVAALLVAWVVTGIVIRPLRRVFSSVPAASRADFVGQLCVIRTGRVGADFGQAEVTAVDGSSAIIQVRQSEPDAANRRPLVAGSTALIFDYDPDGEFFWVSSYDAQRPQ